jgi:HSP20 family protein
MTIVRRDPVAEMLPLRDVMNHLFEQSLVHPSGPSEPSAHSPMDVYTEGDNYVVELALPGVEPEAVEISILGSQITISGEYAAPDKARQYLHRERSAGRFERTLTLPTDLDSDKAEARSESGVLRLTVPKVESAKARRVAVNNKVTNKK